MRFADKTDEKYSDFEKSALKLAMAFVACLIL